MGTNGLPKYKHPLYSIWKGMLWRCADLSDTRYGGRGIRVCDRWLHDFYAFVQDVSPRPSSKHSIDRFPNRDGNYEPGNVRWATALEQANNKDHVYSETTHTLSSYMTAEEAEVIRGGAERAGISVSAYLRDVSVKAAGELLGLCPTCMSEKRTAPPRE